MNDYRIVPASLDRVPEVARLFKESFRAVYPGFPELHTADEDRELFTATVFPKYTVRLAETKTGELLGFIAYDHEWIAQLYLAPVAQRRGIGTALARRAQADSSYLQAWTFQVNSGARAFYARLGFREVEMTDGSGNAETQPDVRLEWRRQD